jgi:hypothetical protein
MPALSSAYRWRAPATGRIRFDPIDNGADLLLGEFA